jgi:sugar (pentulose or hexulose) kinase
MTPGHRRVGVVDIGKSNAKFAVVDLDLGAEIAVRKIANTPRADDRYTHFDVDGLWEFLLGAIADLNADHKLDALSITTHGASAALVGRDGSLALPVLDYEYFGPDELTVEYDAERPDWTESFTPRLPHGLNLGAQLFWQQTRFPAEFAAARYILPYPQYWGFRLTGEPASEITSLGCHTDLWNFETGLYSSLVMREGWIEKLPAVRPAFDVLGPVESGLCQRLGLPPRIPVHVGIHDSNASLLPHLVGREPPFSVVSTGTWVIAVSPGGDLGSLDPERDCLANIDAFGRPVPSARFMGGREFQQLTHGELVTPAPEAVDRLLDEKTLLLPSVQSGSGPFPGREARWSRTENTLSPDERSAAISFYLALMTAECLGMTGGEGDIVVEGPFSGNSLYMQMLGAATGRPVLAGSASTTGTSIGAALLVDRRHTDPHVNTAGVAIEPRLAARMAAYAMAWRQVVPKPH